MTSDPPYPTAKQVIEFLLTLPLDSEVVPSSMYGMDHAIEIQKPGGDARDTVMLWDEIYGFDPDHRLTKKEEPHD